MFVLRAKAKLSDASDEYALYGMAGMALAANDVDPGALPGRATAVAAVLSGEVELPRDGQTHVLVAGSGEGGLF